MAPDKQPIVDVSHLGTDIGELEGLDEPGSVIRVFESLQMGVQELNCFQFVVRRTIGKVCEYYTNGGDNIEASTRGIVIVSYRC